MANLTSTTITGTLDATSTITGPGSGVSALNASNVSSGTLSNDRLDTVPTTKGGTGLTSIGSAGQVLKVAAPGSALEFGDAGGGGNYELVAFTSPGTWTKDTGLVAVKVTVIGGGGGGGGGNNPSNSEVPGGSGAGGGGSIEYIPAASIPGPVSVTVGPAGSGNPGPAPGGTGGTSSFGAFLSATGGTGGTAGGNPNPSGRGGTGGAGSGGQINVSGQDGSDSLRGLPGASMKSSDFPGGDGAFGFGLGGQSFYRSNTKGPGGKPATGYGGGGGAGAWGGTTGPASGAGTAGIVIVEEFY